jgi:hypothetical protein
MIKKKEPASVVSRWLRHPRVKLRTDALKVAEPGCAKIEVTTSEYRPSEDD